VKKIDKTVVFIQYRTAPTERLVSLNRSWTDR